MLFIILGLSFTLIQLIFNEDPKAISAKEAEAMATELYSGKVLESKVEAPNYLISLENDKGIYELYIDRKTEKIKNVKLIERKESLLTIDEAKRNIEQELKGKVIDIKEVKQNEQLFAEAKIVKDNKQYKVDYDLVNKKLISSQLLKDQEEIMLISKQKAKEIAIKQLPGKVTALTTVTTEKGPHYVVTVDGNKEDAQVYVQSNTGIVTSTYWTQLDDDEDDDRDDDGNNNRATNLNISEPKEANENKTTKPKNTVTNANNDNDDDDDDDGYEDDDD